MISCAIAAADIVKVKRSMLLETGGSTDAMESFWAIGSQGGRGHSEIDDSISAADDSICEKMPEYRFRELIHQRNQHRLVVERAFRQLIYRRTQGHLELTSTPPAVRPDDKTYEQSINSEFVSEEGLVGFTLVRTCWRNVDQLFRIERAEDFTQLIDSVRGILASVSDMLAKSVSHSTATDEIAEQVKRHMQVLGSTCFPNYHPVLQPDTSKIQLNVKDLGDIERAVIYLKYRVMHLLGEVKIKMPRPITLQSIASQLRRDSSSSSSDDEEFAAHATEGGNAIAFI